MLRIVDIVVLKRYDKCSSRTGYFAQPTEAGRSVLEAEVLFDV
jgi:hypothetical protein